MNNRLIQSLLILLMLGSVLWTGYYYNHQTEKIQWRDKVSDQKLTLEEIEQISPQEVPESELLAELSDYIESEFIPRRYDLSSKFMNEAIIRKRFYSNYWSSLADTSIWLGEIEDARLYLSISEQLDPGYTDQLLSSLVAWVLLAEDKKPLEIFERIANLDPDATDEAMQSMNTAGIPLSSYINFIPFEECTDSTLVSMANILSKYNKAEYKQYVQYLDYSEYNSNNKRNLMVSAIYADYFPIVFDVYHDIFLKDENNALSVFNSELELSPLLLDINHMIGWHKLPDSLRNRVTWTEKYFDSNGLLRIDLPPSETQEHIVWKAFTFILPEHVESCDLSINLFLSDPEKTVINISLTNENSGQRIRSTNSNSEDESWQTIEFNEIELNSNQRIISVWFGFGNLEQGIQLREHVMIDGVEIKIPEHSDDAEATEQAAER